MSVQLSEILSEITAKTRNSTTGALDNSKRIIAINRIIQDLQDYADWKFLKRTKKFDLIHGISEYNLKDYIGCTCQDNDGTTTILDFKNPYDLRPVDDKSLEHTEDIREVRDNIRRTRTKKEYAIDYDRLIINYPRQNSSPLHNCDSLTADGTITANGDATNLTLDTIVMEEGNGSINFDVSGGTSMVITFTNMTAKDFTDFKNQSHVIVKAYLPTITNFSSITTKWGSSASDYWQKTETLPAADGELDADWNTFAFKWADATETGTPNVEAINYLQITLTYSSAVTDTDFRLDDIRIGKSKKFELGYYSLAMTQDAAGDYQLEFNPDTPVMTDTLIGGTIARPAITGGAIHECFEMIGGKSERDRTDSYEKYNLKKVELLKKAGNRIRRGIKILNFKR